MTIERRKTDRRVSPAIGDFALQERCELLARIESQSREIERLARYVRFESLYAESMREHAKIVLDAALQANK